MFAMVSYYNSYLWLQLLLSLLLLGYGYAQSYIGDRCSSPQGPGACQLIHQCPSVYNGLKSGKWPTSNCGFQGSTPIVCCPSINGPYTPVTTGRPPQSIWGKEPRVSSRMCAEYQQRSMINPRIGSRISGGSEASIQEFPHAVAVGYNTDSSTSWDCGGTLISEKFVLTAAHCLKSPRWGEPQWVRLGSSALDKSNRETQLVRIAERIGHPEFKRAFRYNDIALLKLERSVSLNSNVMPACLDTGNNLPGGTVVVAAGWGLTSNDVNSRSLNLLKVELPIVARANCAVNYGEGSPYKLTSLPRSIDDQSQICAGGKGKNTCKGDSGGPVLVNTGNAQSLPVVVGISSFGQVCTNDVPGVYTRVSFYLPWIERIVWANE